MDEDLNNPVEETESEGKHLPGKDFYNRHIGRLSGPVRVLGVIVILIVLILIGRTIHHHIKANQTASSGSTSQQTAQQQSGANTKAAKNPASTNTKSSTANTGSASSSSAGTPSEVPNTGPGDIAELFVGTSVLAGWGHYIASRRKKL